MVCKLAVLPSLYVCVLVGMGIVFKLAQCYQAYMFVCWQERALSVSQHSATKLICLCVGRNGIVCKLAQCYKDYVCVLVRTGIVCKLAQCLAYQALFSFPGPVHTSLPITECILFKFIMPIMIYAHVQQTSMFSHVFLKCSFKKIVCGYELYWTLLVCHCFEDSV